MEIRNDSPKVIRRVSQWQSCYLRVPCIHNIIYSKDPPSFDTLFSKGPSILTFYGLYLKISSLLERT